MAEIARRVEELLEAGIVGTGEFEERIKRAGRDLAQLVVSSTPAAKVVCVVTPAQERDFLAIQMKDAFHSDTRITVSSLWTKFQPASELARAHSSLLAQHNDQHPKVADLLISVSSTFAEPASVADSFARLAERIVAKRCVLSALFATSQEQGAVLDEISLRSDARPEILLLYPDLAPAFPSQGQILLERHRSHLLAAYGHKGQAYTPISLGGPEPKYKLSQDLSPQI